MKSDLKDIVKIKLLSEKDLTNKVRDEIRCAQIAILSGEINGGREDKNNKNITDSFIYLDNTNLSRLFSIFRKSVISDNAYHTHDYALLPVIESKELIDILCPNGEEEVLFGGRNCGGGATGGF